MAATSMQSRASNYRPELDEAERALTQAAPAGATGPPGERVAG